jgi:hypothetical protein
MDAARPLADRSRTWRAYSPRTPPGSVGLGPVTNAPAGRSRLDETPDENSHQDWRPPELSTIRRAQAIEMIERSHITPQEPPVQDAPRQPDMQVSVTGDHLTALLAERVMHWRVGPDRFLIGDRRWLPRWRFRPAECLPDAFRLLEQAAPQEYSMGAGVNGGFWVKVRIAGTTGEALERSKPRAITYAVARAFRIDVDSSKTSIIDASGARRTSNE